MSPVFMATSQSMAEGHWRGLVYSILKQEKASCVRPSDTNSLPVTVVSLLVSSLFREALNLNHKSVLPQTHVFPPMLRADISFTSFAILKLLVCVRLVADMVRAARRPHIRPGKEVLEARVAPFEVMSLENRTPSMTLHSENRRWLCCLMLLAAFLLLTFFLFWVASTSQGVVKWLTTHLRQSWCLVATTASTCRLVFNSTLWRLGHSLIFLARGSKRCWISILQTNRLLIALALPCCTLLHLALSAILMSVRAVRHALRNLEHNLPTCPHLVLMGILMLWRCFITAIITLVFAAVAAHAR